MRTVKTFDFIAYHLYCIIVGHEGGVFTETDFLGRFYWKIIIDMSFIHPRTVGNWWEQRLKVKVMLTFLYFHQIFGGKIGFFGRSRCFLLLKPDVYIQRMTNSTSDTKSDETFPV